MWGLLTGFCLLQNSSAAMLASRLCVLQPVHDVIASRAFESVTCREVRKQTCDLITLLEMAQPLSHYYLFMEDDFR